jgi:hypothetical protein
MKWIIATALILQFIAFWFAAPELLGEKTLKRMRLQLQKLLSFLPMLIIWVVVLGYGLTFTISGLIKAYKGATSGISQSEIVNYYVILGICTIAYFIFIFRYKKIKNALDQRLAMPLVNKLIERSEFRSTALTIGAILFTLGFIIQLAVVLMT